MCKHGEEKLISTLKSKFESGKTRNIYPRDNYNNLLSFGANEMSICKQDLMFQEEINCETTISVREAASNQSLSGGITLYISLNLLTNNLKPICNW
jgi:hypothetical protein